MLIRRIIQLFAFILIIAPPCLRAIAGQPEPAREILDSAVKEAEASHRTVFLIFHASWCGWCKKLDAVLETPEVKKLIEENYVVVHLDVQERGEKIGKLENPGGEEIMNELGGKDSGLPFYAFIDGGGKKIADSKMEGPARENIGYPGSEEEVTLFGTLLSQTAPRLTGEQRAFIAKHFHREGA
jgi:thioredoxin-related protein